MGILGDILDVLSDLGDSYEKIEKLKEKDSAEIVEWFSTTLLNYGGNFDKFVSNEGTTVASYVINRIGLISESKLEDDYIKIMAELQYASCLIDGVSNVLEPNPYKGVLLLRNILNEVQYLDTDDYYSNIIVNDIKARACYLLGICYATGKGCMESSTNAEKYIRKAANLGLAEAEDLLDMLEEI